MRSKRDEEIEKVGTRNNEGKITNKKKRTGKDVRDIYERQKTSNRERMINKE